MRRRHDTVTLHVRRILGKLGLSSRADAAVFALFAVGVRVGGEVLDVSGPRASGDRMP